MNSNRSPTKYTRGNNTLWFIYIIYMFFDSSKNHKYFRRFNRREYNTRATTQTFIVFDPASTEKS